MSRFAGLFPPIPTPFTDDERLAVAALESNLEGWLGEPIDGIVVPGSNSEAAYLDPMERGELWKICGKKLEGTGRVMIAGSGAETTAATIRATRQAADLGAAAALILPPAFYKPAMTPEALVAHYHAVAEAVSIPLLAYNVPVYSGIDFTLPTLIELAHHPRIIGIKDSSANVVKMAGLLAAVPEFAVFAGTGTALLPFLSLGAVGSIAALANIAARPMRAILDAWQAGEWSAARQLQLNLAGLNDCITARFGVPGLKYAMDQLGLYGGPVRRPLLPLPPAARAEIDRHLAALSQ